VRLNFGLAVGAVVIAFGTQQCGGAAFSSAPGADEDASGMTGGDDSGLASSGAAGGGSSSNGASTCLLYTSRCV